MKILITGSSGYIGGNFFKKYHNKYLFERFSLQKEKLNNIKFNEIHTVLHCAALVHQEVEHSYETYYEINVKYPVELAKLAKKNGVKQFVFISTIAVYGENEKKLQENTICNPITSYGKSKLEAEKELLKLNDSSFVVSIIRPPMVYGKNAPGNINSLINLVRKVPIIPLGGIENKRSFISIQNLCNVIDKVITEQKSGIFLVADDKSISTSKLIELIAKNLEKKVYLIKIPFFENLLKFVNPSFHRRLYESLEVDNSFIKEKLNIKNLHSVEEGMKFMIKGENI